MRYFVTGYSLVVSYLRSIGETGNGIEEFRN